MPAMLMRTLPLRQHKCARYQCLDSTHNAKYDASLDRAASMLMKAGCNGNTVTVTLPSAEAVKLWTEDILKWHW